MDYSDTVILYDKYLSTMGGGERYALKFFDTVIKQWGKKGIVLSPSTVQKDDVKKRFGIELENVDFIEIPNLPYIPQKFHHCNTFINATDRSTISGIGRMNILIVYFPVKMSVLGKPFSYISLLLSKMYSKNQHKFLSLSANFLARFKSAEFIRTYDRIFSISEFTHGWVKKYWNTDTAILYPPVNIHTFANTQTKKNYILGVGRFFQGDVFVSSHNKRQDMMINSFKKLQNQYKDSIEIQNTELHLAGSLGHEERDAVFFKYLQDMAEGYKIYFHPSLTLEELKSLYADSKIFWHATGADVDESKYPERMEHFGITTVEAMSAGCIPVVIQKGGQKEIISDDENGFLWKTEEELIEKTRRILLGEVNVEEISRKAKETISRFAEECFAESIQKQVIFSDKK